MATAPTAFHRLARISLLLLLVAFAAGLLLPVYSDEIGWRFQERAGFDGVDKFYSDSCGAGTIARPPPFMMPVRWYSALFNGLFPDPLAIRLSGVGYAMLWACMLPFLARRVAPARGDVLAAIGVALMGLGVMPLLLVWSRPEQPILLAVTAALLIAFRPGGGGWAAGAGVLACALVAFSYHFKALLLVPAFAACLWIAVRPGGRAIRAVLLALLAAASFAATSYWFGRLACPDDPIAASRWAAQSLGCG